MWGGYKISRKTKADIEDIMNWLDRAKDSLEIDSNTRHAEIYIKRAIEICKKYVG